MLHTLFCSPEDVSLDPRCWKHNSVRNYEIFCHFCDVWRTIFKAFCWSHHFVFALKPLSFFKSWSCFFCVLVCLIKPVIVVLFWHFWCQFSGNTCLQKDTGLILQELAGCLCQENRILASVHSGQIVLEVDFSFTLFHTGDNSHYKDVFIKRQLLLNLKQLPSVAGMCKQKFRLVKHHFPRYLRYQRQSLADHDSH